MTDWKRLQHVKSIEPDIMRSLVNRAICNFEKHRFHLCVQYEAISAMKLITINIFNMVQSRPNFGLFSSFSHSNNNYGFISYNIKWESVNVALGIRTRGRRIQPQSYGGHKNFIGDLLQLVLKHFVSDGCEK